MAPRSIPRTATPAAPVIGDQPASRWLPPSRCWAIVTATSRDRLCQGWDHRRTESPRVGKRSRRMCAGLGGQQGVQLGKPFDTPSSLLHQRHRLARRPAAWLRQRHSARAAARCCTAHDALRDSSRHRVRMHEVAVQRAMLEVAWPGSGQGPPCPCGAWCPCLPPLLPNATQPQLAPR